MENENVQKEQKTEESSLPKLTEMVDRLEKANKEAREILARQEELAARKLLGGTIDSVQPAQPKEETPKEYVRKLLGG